MTPIGTVLVLWTCIGTVVGVAGLVDNLMFDSPGWRTFVYSLVAFVSVSAFTYMMAVASAGEQ